MIEDDELSINLPFHSLDSVLFISLLNFVINIA